jgi:hypothetical protein
MGNSHRHKGAASHITDMVRLYRSPIRTKGLFFLFKQGHGAKRTGRGEYAHIYHLIDEEHEYEAQDEGDPDDVRTRLSWCASPPSPSSSSPPSLEDGEGGVSRYLLPDLRKA